MAQKNRAVSRMFFLILMLTLISCCFLGSTFARYTTTDDASAKFNVASWKVSHAEGDTVTVFDSLSPSMKDYTAMSGEDATNSTAKKLVATITNDGEVDALVSLYSEFGDIARVEGTEDDSTYDEADIKGLFTINLTYGTTGVAETDTETDLNRIELNTADQKTIYVWASVTWTTSYKGSADGAAADKLDTWVGQNVESVSFKISYTAVQNSQSPAGN